jgi:ribonuclease P protein component
MGFTATRKPGNAAARNRAKRRMREIARLDFGANRESVDIVIVAREGITIVPFAKGGNRCPRSRGMRNSR